MTTPHQSGAPFVGERVFQNQGVCGQALPSFPSPTPFFPPFCSRPIFARPQCENSFAWPEFRSLRTGTLATLATQATWSPVVTRGHSWSLVVTRGHSWSLVSTFRPYPYRTLKMPRFFKDRPSFFHIQEGKQIRST